MASLPALSQMLSRLSEREKRLVFLTSAVAVVFIGFFGFTAIDSFLDKREKRIAARKSEITELEALRERYDEAVSAEKKSAARIRSNTQSLFSIVQKAAAEAGTPVPDLQERRLPVKDSPDMSEISVDLSLKEISVDKLTTLLEKIEGKRSDGVVKVTKLKVKTRFDNPEMLEANLTVTTWRGSGAAPPADAAPGATP